MKFRIEADIGAIPLNLCIYPFAGVIDSILRFFARAKHTVQKPQLSFCWIIGRVGTCCESDIGSGAVADYTVDKGNGFRVSAHDDSRPPTWTRPDVVSKSAVDKISLSSRWPGMICQRHRAKICHHGILSYHLTIGYLHILEDIVATRPSGILGPCLKHSASQAGIWPRLGIANADIVSKYISSPQV